MFIGPEGIKATVLTATVGIGGVATYEVVYWTAGSRNVNVVAACELRGDKARKLAMGFAAK